MTMISRKLQDRILDCFQSGHYLLGSFMRLAEVVESKDVETAAVECHVQPRLLINPDFVERWADTPEQLFMLIMHELHHVSFGHTLQPATALDNLVFDAVINAGLCQIFSTERYCSLFTRFYREDLFPECFLRPSSAWLRGDDDPTPLALLDPQFAEAAATYRSLYGKTGATYDEIRRALLKTAASNGSFQIVLLGNHTERGSASGAMTGTILDDVIGDLKSHWPHTVDPGRSDGDTMRKQKVAPKRVPSNRNQLAQPLRKLAGRGRAMTGQKAPGTAPVPIATPVPHFDRRCVILTALGAPPLLYTGSVTAPCPQPSDRVHVYLDVSGSMGRLVSSIYGAVLDCHDLVHPVIHLFSTNVADVTLEALRRGVCQTTGGTDINCVADHMLERRVRRAVLISDGAVGSPGEQQLHTLTRTHLGVALTHDWPWRCTSFGHNVVDHWIRLADTSTGR